MYVNITFDGQIENIEKGFCVPFENIKNQNLAHDR